MERKEWAVCAAMLASFYPDNFKLAEKTQVEMWFMALSHLPGERVKAAILHMARTQKAFPSVADVCQIAEPPRLEADEAWREVMRYAMSVHAVATVYELGQTVEWQWSDQIIPAVLRGFGGGREIAMAKADDLPIIRAQFQKAYDAAKKRESKQETFSALGVGESLKVLPGGLEQIQKGVGNV